MNDKHARMLENIIQAMPKSARGRVLACILRLVTGHLGPMEPVVERAIRNLEYGDLTKAKRSWSALKRQVSSMRSDPSWGPALRVIDSVMASGEWVSSYTLEAASKILPPRFSSEEQAGFFASNCIDDELCRVWDSADASGLISILAAVQARRAMAGGLATIGIYLAKQITGSPPPLEVIMTLEQTLLWADFKGQPPERVEPVFRWSRVGGGYITSGAAYTAWVPYAPIGYSGRAVDLSGAGHTAINSYSRIRVITAEDPGGWKGQGEEKRILADVIRSVVKCPSARDAIDGAYSE